MKIFQIYQKDDQDLSKVRIVTSGISFVAAIFNIFWALYNRNWIIFIPLLIIYFAIYSNEYAVNLFNGFKFLAFLLLAEEMQVYNLKSKGYRMVDLVYAKTEDEARYQFIQRNTQYA